MGMDFFHRDRCLHEHVAMERAKAAADERLPAPLDQRPGVRDRRAESGIRIVSILRPMTGVSHQYAGGKDKGWPVEFEHDLEADALARHQSDMVCRQLTHSNVR